MIKGTIGDISGAWTIGKGIFWLIVILLCIFALLTIAGASQAKEIKPVNKYGNIPLDEYQWCPTGGNLHYIKLNASDDGAGYWLEGYPNGSAHWYFIGESGWVSFTICKTNYLDMHDEEQSIIIRNMTIAIDVNGGTGESIHSTNMNNYLELDHVNMYPLGDNPIRQNYYSSACYDFNSLIRINHSNINGLVSLCNWYDSDETHIHQDYILNSTIQFEYYDSVALPIRIQAVNYRYLHVFDSNFSFTGYSYCMYLVEGFQHHLNFINTDFDVHSEEIIFIYLSNNYLKWDGLDNVNINLNWSNSKFIHPSIGGFVIVKFRSNHTLVFFNQWDSDGEHCTGQIYKLDYYDNSIFLKNAINNVTLVWIEQGVCYSPINHIYIYYSHTWNNIKFTNMGLHFDLKIYSPLGYVRLNIIDPIDWDYEYTGFIRDSGYHDFDIILSSSQNIHFRNRYNGTNFTNQINKIDLREGYNTPGYNGDTDFIFEINHNLKDRIINTPYYIYHEVVIDGIDYREQKAYAVLYDWIDDNPVTLGYLRYNHTGMEINKDIYFCQDGFYIDEYANNILLYAFKNITAKFLIHNYTFENCYDDIGAICSPSIHGGEYWLNIKEFHFYNLSQAEIIIIVPGGGGSSGAPGFEFIFVFISIIIVVLVGRSRYRS